MYDGQEIVTVMLLLGSATLVCPVVECPQGQGCTPCKTLSSSHFQIFCGKKKDLSGPHFQIEYGPTVFDGEYNDVLDIKCVGGPEWSDFHLGTEKTMKLVSVMSFTDCNLPASIQLISIVRQLFDGDAAEAEGSDSRHRELLPADVRELKFNSYGNLSSSLTGTTLAGFSYCVTVDLSHNGLQTVPEDLLRDFVTLQTLNLRYNDLREIPPMFLNLTLLQNLILEGNKLLVVKSSTFARFSKLQTLNLAYNQIAEIDKDSFEALAELRRINLRGNDLKSLPPRLFHYLDRLDDLNLSNNNFSSNFLSNLHYSLSENLKIFELSHNKQNLMTLPGNFLPSRNGLDTLKLEDNGITHLPHDLLFGVPNLRTLSLSSNNLINLPDCLFRKYDYFHTFDLINLSRNHLTEIYSYHFEGIRKIWNLDISYNRIDFRLNELPLKEVPNVDNLTEVEYPYELVCTKEQETHPYIFLPPPIGELNFENNHISTFLSGWLRERLMTNLRLRNNQITHLSHSDLLFHSMHTIELDLRDNKITSIDLSGFESPKFNLSKWHMTVDGGPVVSLQVMNNPIKCDCSIYHLLRHHENGMSPTIQQLFQISIEGLTCAGPPELQDVPVKHLNSKTLQCRLPRSSPDDRTCPDACDCLHRVEDRAFIVNCSHRGLQTFPTINRPGFYSVTVLFLSFNEISNLSLNALPDNLKELYLHGNNLTQLDKDVIRFLTDSAELKSLTLHENPWKCDCDTLDFFKFIQSKQSTLADLQRVTCNSLDTPIFKMTSKDMCPPSLSMIVGTSMAAILLLVTAILAAVYYRYETEIKVWLFAHRLLPWLVNEAELDRDKIYDAFISYSHQDEDFVANTLVPKLEEGPRAFKLCVHYRDWLAGEFITEQIARSVADSRRTIVVLSRNFLASEWGRMEFRTAHSTALSEGRARVIVIIYGDIGPIDELGPELASYMRTNTYITWGDRWFWEKLRYALPHPTDLLKGIGTVKGLFHNLPRKSELASEIRIQI